MLYIIYILSVLVCGTVAIYLLREELRQDRRHIDSGYPGNVTWLKILMGAVGIFIPIFNSIVVVMLIAYALDRPVITKRKKS